MKRIAIGMMMMTQAAFAGPLVESAANIKRLSDRVSHLSERIEYGNSRPVQERRLKQQLTAMIQEARSMKALLGGGGSGPLPPTYGLYVTAECHVDNDPWFNYGEQVFQVAGASVAEVISTCKEMAKATYPNRQHSTGIAKVKTTGSLPHFTQTATCHIDNDQWFNFNETVIGTLKGQTLQDMVAQCELIAQDAFNGNGSASIYQVNENNPIPSNMMSATCHMDNDPWHNFDEYVAGVVVGHTISAMSAECNILAQDAFNGNGSSALRDIQ